jgi:hypothetical protein
MCEILQFIGTYVVLPFAVSAYAAVVISRVYQFYDAKKDAWETIITMEHELVRPAKTLDHPWASARLNSPTQRMRYFGHSAAAKEVDCIAKDIEAKLTKASADLGSGIAKVQIPRGEWETRIVALHYNWWAIFQPWRIKF